MIGFVIVSHSAKIAEGVCELAGQVAQGRCRLIAAGGSSDPASPIGTNAFAVLAAIESVFSEDGVVVCTDLGSAVLSAETALELLDDTRRLRVRISTASLVEGTVAAVSLAAAGAALDEVMRDGVALPGATMPAAGERVTLTNPHGLHARPAAQLIRLARRFNARVWLRNLATGGEPVDASGITGILASGARQGHELLVQAEGPEALEAARAVTEFLASGCGDLDTAPAAVAGPPGDDPHPALPDALPSDPFAHVPSISQGDHRSAPEGRTSLHRDKAPTAPSLAPPVDLVGLPGDAPHTAQPDSRPSDVQVPSKSCDHPNSARAAGDGLQGDARQTAPPPESPPSDATAQSPSISCHHPDTPNAAGPVLHGDAPRTAPHVSRPSDAIAQFPYKSCHHPDSAHAAGDGLPGDELAPPYPRPSDAIESSPSCPTTTSQPAAEAPAPRTHIGIPASPGIAIGPLVHLRQIAIAVQPGRIDDPAGEEQRLQAALRHAQNETCALRDSSGPGQSGIFDAQLLSLEDPDLAGAASGLIRNQHANAAFAWHTAAQSVATRLAAIEDPYLRARAIDIEDAVGRVLRHLTGATPSVPVLAAPSILAARDLTPSEVQSLDRERVLGVCLEMGSASAHSAILARALGIPAVVGLGPALSALPEGAIVAIDGERGEVFTTPSPQVLRDLEQRRSARQKACVDARAGRARPAATRDGRRIRVVANISGVYEAAGAVECGAEGIGVLRTEFLFLHRASPPAEEEQLAAYRAIATALGDRPLVIRTLDIGGDKPVPYVGIGAEANPFLGWRGIRLTLGRLDLLRTQLRAILRAGPTVEVLLPMVTTLDELRAVKALLAGIQPDRMPKLGVMIETPAAVAISPELAREADFFSIGTNDLVQYVMVADRTNPRVAALADPFQPAVLRMLRHAIDAAHAAGIPATICGEMGADALAMPLLIGLGMDELSVSAALITGVKQNLARWTLAEAAAITRAALAADTVDAVRQTLAGSTYNR